MLSSVDLFNLGWAIGLAEGGWSSDCLYHLKEHLPFLHKEMVDLLNKGEIEDSKWGLAEPLKKIGLKVIEEEVERLNRENEIIRKVIKL